MAGEGGLRGGTIMETTKVHFSQLQLQALRKVFPTTVLNPKTTPPEQVWFYFGQQAVLQYLEGVINASDSHPQNGPDL